MKISFIVITYHRGQLLNRCLESIYTQQNIPYPFEVIVIDNGKDVLLPQPDNPQIKLRVETPTGNLGVAGGRNLGMRYAQGDYWIILDDDATWHDNFDASRLVEHLERDPTVGAVAIQILDPKGEQVESLLTHPDKKAVRELDKPIEVPYFYGGGHILRAKAIQEVGDYPERFFYAMEEVDICLRIIDAGYKILYDPAVAAYHHTDQTGRTVYGENYWKRNALNKSRVGWRLLPLPYPITIMIIWGLAVLVKTRRFGPLWEVLRDLWRERQLLASERKTVKPKTVRYLKSIGARLLY
ncbi:MAG: glycosyltransferase [Chloroflexi bacterium]|nr:glycosyltransferase [Chloroflexota bacterium]MCC6895041.1 glycosyltransferase [Anaerolineae bacterium]